MNTKIFQIFFDFASRLELDQGCIPVNNSKPERRNEYEYGVMRRLYFDSQFSGADLYGVFSWKFRRKYGQSPLLVSELLAPINNVDVVICNPYPQSDYFHNVWHQGDRCHPGMIAIAKDLFVRSSLDEELIDLRMDKETECYCNYWLGSRRFMDLYFSFCERIYSTVYADSGLKGLMLEGIQHRMIRAPWFPFIFERLFSTFLTAHKSSFRIISLTKPHGQGEPLGGTRGLVT